MLSSELEVTLIAKSDTFISQEAPKSQEKNSFSLELIHFKKSFSFSLINSISTIIKEKNIKNVIFFGASELKSLYFAFLGKDINLIIRHGTTKHRSKKDILHRRLYSQVNYHVAICEHLAKNVEKIIPFGKNTQLKVIYPSLNLQATKNIDFDAKPHQPLQLLHVGRIAEGKGQREAIEACEILYQNSIDFELKIVGSFHEPYEKIFTQFLQNIQYQDSITLVGHTDNVEKYYLNADIFIFPSEGEGLSNAFIEALYYGLKCISYKNTSFPELQKLGLEFEIVEDRNIQSLKDTLLHSIIEIKEDKNKLKIEKLFSLSKEKEEMLKILI